MAHLAQRSIMEATGLASPKSEFGETGERWRVSIFLLCLCVYGCRLAGYDMVITTYNIVGIEGESCEPQPVTITHLYYKY